jgi:formate dehydrogenase subunit gamma
VSVRIAHWLLASAFASMLGSGVLMGGVGPLDHHAMLVLHVASAVVLVAGLAGLLVVRRSRRPLTRLVRDLRPIDASDRRWLRLAPRAYLSGGPLPRAGRFNAGQKVNARLVLLALTVLYLSGLGELRRHVPALAPFGFLAGVHGLAAGLAALLVGFHVYLAVLHPTTRPALRGMTLGTVRRDWAEHHHADWVAALEDPLDDR